MGEVFALEGSQENSMTLAFFFFPLLPCFLYQKQHVVKCLHHRHWPFLLVEKGCAVLRWPGGQERALPGAAALMASPSAAPAGQRLSLLTPPLLCNLERRLCSPELPSLLPLPFSLSLSCLFIRDFAWHLSEVTHCNWEGLLGKCLAFLLALTQMGHV